MPRSDVIFVAALAAINVVFTVAVAASGHWPQAAFQAAVAVFCAATAVKLHRRNRRSLERVARYERERAVAREEGGR